MNKFMKKILRKFVCGNIPETEGEIGVDESVLFESETRFSNMLDHNNRVMDNLKVQTECYKSEIEALKQEILRLRVESHTRESLSNDSGCSIISADSELPSLIWDLPNYTADDSILENTEYIKSCFPTNCGNVTFV
jgi:hypothetical protein